MAERTIQSNNICLAVWDADGACTGWQPSGSPVHGCQKRPSHGDDHQCRCGHPCRRGETKIFPRYE